VGLITVIISTEVYRIIFESDLTIKNARWCTTNYFKIV